ncbi:hypothetical protein KAI04_04100 [Candidatus Pacearchaeota archaeon]|nr:hypothetical protein [Candidatus Pacearchaeota archaeon]
MNKRHKYRIFTEVTNDGFKTECSMGNQRMKKEEIGYLKVLVNKYNNIIKYHTKLMNNDKQIKSLETKIDIDFEEGMKGGLKE